jgi:hypothetical protein
MQFGQPNRRVTGLTRFEDKISMVSATTSGPCAQAHPAEVVEEQVAQ